ncbi:MAG TPA: anti-sigma factor [Glaciibacter sp.]|nr:anti-sigma factor [Glaciibacter sp.]
MTHLDDESLALLALGEALPDANQREHLLTCSRCEAEVASLTRLVSIGRTSRGVEIVQPPASVWNRIHAELGLSDGLVGVPSERSPDEQDAVVTPIRPPGARAASWLLVAAALVLGVAAGAVGSSLLSRSDDPTVLAEAVLEPFPDWPASGAARVEEDADGSREVVVDLSAPSGGLREVWLIDPDTSGLVSLGLLSGTSGTFSIPEDLDLSRYSVVDVSDEPDDGDPAHSGNSIVRGPLSSV